MEKILLGPEMGELADGTAPAMSVGVATERATGYSVSLSGLVYPEGDLPAQAEGVFDIIEDILTNDLEGRMEDVTLLRFYLREESLTDEVRVQLHERRRERFEGPEYPAATMIGVADLVHEDAAVEIEAEAFVPDGMWDTTVVTPDDE